MSRRPPTCARLLWPALMRLATTQVFLLPEFLAITMEYAAGGDLFQLVGRAGGLREEDAKWYFQQLIVAIDYCHRMVCASLQLEPLRSAAFERSSS